MKTKLLLLLIFMMNITLSAQNPSQTKTIQTMKLNAGIITTKIAETKDFYTQHFGFTVVFENEFYLLLHTPDGEDALSFLLPHHPSQQPLFHKPFLGQGMYLTIEVEDVDAMYASIRQQGVPIKIELRDEPWGDRHFAIEDPNGIGIDVVKFTKPATD